MRPKWFHGSLKLKSQVEEVPCDRAAGGQEGRRDGKVDQHTAMHTQPALNTTLHLRTMDRLEVYKPLPLFGIVVGSFLIFIKSQRFFYLTVYCYKIFKVLNNLLRRVRVPVQS